MTNILQKIYLCIKSKSSGKMQLTEEELKARQRKWNRESQARKRAKLKAGGYCEYTRPVKKKHFRAMDAKLAELEREDAPFIYFSPF